MKAYAFIYFIFWTSLMSAHPPWGIQVDDQGRIYFVDILHEERGALWQYDPRSDELTCLLSDFHSHNVQLGHDGNLYLAHGEGHQTMVRLCPDGTIDTLLSVDDHRELNGGNCVVSDEGELFFYASKYLWRRNGKRAKERVTNRAFEWSQTTYIDREGNIYLPEIGSGNGDLFKISSNGKVRQIASDLITRLDRDRDRHMDVLLGITTDNNGVIFVCETAGKRIARIESNRVDTWYEGKDGWYPTGLTFHNGAAFILEHEWTRNGLAGPRVVQKTENGKTEVLLDLNTYDKDKIIR